MTDNEKKLIRFQHPQKKSVLLLAGFQKRVRGQPPPALKIVVDGGMMKLYVVGGGSCLIKNFGEFDTGRVVINEDICATAKGYEYLARLRARKGDSGKPLGENIYANEINVIIHTPEMKVRQPPGTMWRVSSAACGSMSMTRN